MKRFAGLLAWGMAFAASGAVCGAETATGAAYVTTLPSGADIWIDGTYVGRAPVLVDALLPGRHAVTITKAGWIVREFDVAVAPGAVALSSTRLAAGPRALAASGTAIVRNSPAGAVLEIDGVALKNGVGREVPLSAGPHHIALTTPRGKTTLAFSIFPGTSTELVLAQPQASVARSAVVAPADDYLPDGALVVEGKKIVIRYAGHFAIAHFGDASVKLDGATLALNGVPETIGNRVFLPLELLDKLTAPAAKAP